MNPRSGLLALLLVAAPLAGSAGEEQATQDPSQAAVAPVSVTIDPGLDRHAISPLIYGVNFGSDAQAARLHWPVRRWGGNATTRYSWQHDISNHASDWFFYNIEEDNPNPGALPDGSAVRHRLDGPHRGPHRHGRAGGRPLLRARQRARALEQHAPRRAPQSAHLRRAVAAHDELRGGHEGAGPERAHPGACELGVVRASAISFSNGQVRANNAVLPLSADGQATLAVQASLLSGSAHLVIDVNGYFQ